MARMEGIIPALETSHAIAQAMKLAPTLSKDQVIVSGVQKVYFSGMPVKAEPATNAEPPQAALATTTNP